MAASSLNQKSNNLHARSNSLPCSPHPLILKCNEHLETIKASPSSSSSSSLLSHKLGGLQDLIECVEKLVQLPLTQDALLHDPRANWVDELFDGSLRLLDACTAAKDALLHTKECTRELQSIIRRRRRIGTGDSDGDGEVVVELTTEVKKFLTSRKVVKKAISKALSNLKGAGAAAKNCSISSMDKDHQTVALIRLLQDVEVAALSTFETIIQFISGSTASQSKSNRWISISSKLIIQNGRVGCSQVEEDESEFAQVDLALQSFVFAKGCKIARVSNLQNQLERMESRIQDLEEGLEFLFRILIKIRVSLLNILSH